ncbi:MAG: hypothetical protein M1831_003691 [Alyxoria varia]|nr:MAG: hypothetical protein M1831_003691 [Alyxoria varia]
MTSNPSLLPPFEEQNTFYSSLPYDAALQSQHKPSSTPCTHVPRQKPLLVLPAVHSTYDNSTLKRLDPSNLHTLTSYFHTELDVSRLNVIYDHLWFAGHKRVPRALHHQILIGRNIVITEDPNMHMLWIDSTLFVKPLPEFLLCYDTWRQYICPHPRLYEAAVGMLLSYVWLVRHQSDIKIAYAQGLLPSDLAWTQWSALVADLLSHFPLPPYDAAKPDNPRNRYEYGELRLSRLNTIYRLFAARDFNITTLVRGYFNVYHDYESFFLSKIGYITSATIYVVLALTAMQVGLSTDRLQGSHAFQNVSFGFTVFAIAAPLAAVFGRSTTEGSGTFPLGTLRLLGKDPMDQSAAGAVSVQYPQNNKGTNLHPYIQDVGNGTNSAASKPDSLQAEVDGVSPRTEKAISLNDNISPSFSRGNHVKPRHCSLWRRFPYGFRVSTAFAAALSFVVLLINVSVTAYVGSNYGFQSGLGTVHEGSCDSIRNTSVGLHLLINILSTALLGASNYCMQCLSAPTREAIDKAHEKGRTLKVGMHSVSNLRNKPAKYGWMWTILCLSSLPLHLL